MQTLWVGECEKRINKPGQMILSQLPSKILGVHFVTQKELYV